MLHKIATNYLIENAKKEYNNPQGINKLKLAGLATVNPTPMVTGTLGYYLNRPARDQQGNVTFPGYNNIYDDNDNIIKYEPIKNAPQAKPNQPIGKPLSVLQNFLRRNNQALGSDKRA